MESDVVIFGAGPGGCAAAIVAARAGARVTLLERERFPRHRPGETLHPGLEPLFRQLGAWPRVQAAGYVRHAGIWVDRDGEQRFQAYGSDAQGGWLGLQAVRADLDARLLETAIEHGVAVQQPCDVTAAVVRANRVLGVETAGGRFVAPVTIDASGSRQWLARRMSLRMTHASPRLVARYGYVTGSCPLRDDAPLLRADATGWTWTARVADGTYHWSRLALARGDRTDATLPQEFAGLTSWGPSGGSDVTWRVAHQPAGAGYFLVGDAAMVIDPASSNGVLRAIMSGMQAGHLAAQILSGRHTEDTLARFYCDWIHGWFDHDVRALTELYGPNATRGWRAEDCELGN